MTKVPEIHYLLSLNAETNIEERLQGLLQESVRFIHIQNNSTDVFPEGLIRKYQDKVNFILWNSTGVSGETNTIHFTDINLLEEEGLLKGSFSARANSIAECKNLELKGANFIEVSGENNWQFLIEILPKSDDYGWKVISLNCPVIISGVNSFTVIEEIISKTAVNGFLITDSFEPEISFSDKINTLNKLFLTRK